MCSSFRSAYPRVAVKIGQQIAMLFVVAMLCNAIQRLGPFSLKFGLSHSNSVVRNDHLNLSTSSVVPSKLLQSSKRTGPYRFDVFNHIP